MLIFLSASGSIGFQTTKIGDDVVNALGFIFNIDGHNDVENSPPVNFNNRIKA